MSQHAAKTHQHEAALTADESALANALEHTATATHGVHKDAQHGAHAAREILAGPESRAEAEGFAAPTAHETAHAKRDNVKPPEAVMPKEPTLPTKPPIGAVHGGHAPAALPATRPLDPMELKAAEVALAQYVGTKIAPELSDGLMLSLSDCTEKGAGIKISLNGPHVVGNREELGNSIETVLRDVDALKPLFVLPDTKLHITKLTDKPDVVELHLNGFSVEHYKQAVRGLAAMIPAVSADKVLRNAEDLAATAPIPASSNDAALPAVAPETMLAAAANTNIQGPVAAHDTLMPARTAEAAR